MPRLPAPPSGADSSPVPALIVQAGPSARRRYLEFLAAEVRNPNTRMAYRRAADRFLDWAERAEIPSLEAVGPVHVAAYVEALGRTHAPPSVKLHLAALRRLFGYWVVGQVLPTNPAAAVRGPRHAVRRGKTPVLSAEEARALISGIRTDTVAGLRDRALIGLLLLGFARIGAAVAMRAGDYRPCGKRWWIRLREKGGKEHEMPAHPLLEEYLDAYIAAAGLAAAPGAPLFQTLRGGALTGRPLPRANAYHMVRRRAAEAGLAARIGCHSFRATGLTLYLANGGTLEHAQRMAAHESPRTTQLYDRRLDAVSLAEVERVRF